MPDADASRSPERVLDELCATGHRWIDARVGQRRHGHSGVEATAGDNPPGYVDPDAEDRAARDAWQLGARFRRLVREFIASLEAQ